MTAEQQTLMRVEAATDAPFAIRVNVRALSDEDLAQELAERKAEFDLQVRDLDERKIEGPRTLQADQAASELTRTEKYLDAELAELDTAIEETPRRKLLARKAPQDRADRAEAELAEVPPAGRTSARRSRSRGQSHRVSPAEWNEILRESTPARERHRLEKGPGAGS